MRYTRAADWKQGVGNLTDRLTQELGEGRRVLWLVCGGSNVATAVDVMKNLADDLTKDLTITLTDERYGPPGHADSNWQQLADAGFDRKQARTLPVLEAGRSLAETTEHYQELAKRTFQDSDTVIALFGVGADGHIAGILPGSPAANADDEAWAAGYETKGFTRLTLTFTALRHVDVAYAFAFGEAKRAALSKLRSADIPLDEQPAQLLKRLPEAYLYSDQLKEET